MNILNYKSKLPPNEEKMYNALKSTHLLKDAPLIYFEKCGGMSNTNYKIKIENKKYHLRIPGACSNDIVNRNDELANSLLIQPLHINSVILYNDPQTGIKLTEFIDNSTTCTPRIVQTDAHLNKIAHILKKLHTQPFQFSNTFCMIDELNKYEKLICGYPHTLEKQYYHLKNKLIDLIHYYSLQNTPISPCHNDLVPENFILDAKEKLYLIDWEYSGNNIFHWDLASFISESELNKEQTDLFLNNYFNAPPLKEDLLKIKICEGAQHLLWSLWTKIKEAHGEDFEEYGSKRFQQAAIIINELTNDINE